MVTVRIATLDDAQAILNIYMPFIQHTAITFENEVPSLKEFKERMQYYLQNFPWIVCEMNGDIAGYVYASAHRDREAYQWTCECSVYVHAEHHGKGIGKKLYKALFEILKMQGLVNIYAGITLPNEASIKIHESCRFELFAVYDNVGYKLNAWHKVGWWKLQLNNHQLKPPPPLKFSEMEPALYSDILHQTTVAIGAKITG